MSSSKNSDRSIEQISALIEQSIELHNKDAKRAMVLCQEAHGLLQETAAEGAPYLQGQADLDASLSWLYQHQTEYELALKHGLAAMTLFEQLPNKRYLPHASGSLAMAYFRTGNHDQSLLYFLRQLEISEQLKDRWNIARAHLGLGLIFSRLKDYELAQKHDGQSLEIYEELGDVERIATLINNICLNLLEQSLFDDALEIGLKGLGLDLSEDEHGEAIVFLHSKIHRAYLGLGEIDQAKSYLENASRLTLANPNLFLQGLILRERALMAQQLGDFDEAIGNFKQLLALIEETSIAAFEEQAHLGLYQLFKETDQIDKALFHYEKYHEVVVNELQNQSVVRLNLLTTKHEIEKDQREAEVLRQQSLELQQLVDEKTEQLSESLAREQQLAKNLRRALDQAEMLSQLKSRVIEVVSHEFRTPLSIINTSSTLLGHYSQNLSDEQRSKHLTMVQESIANLNSLIRDVEIVAESRSGNLSVIFELISLDELCANLTDDLHVVEKEMGGDGRLEVQCQAGLEHIKVKTDYGTVKKIADLIFSNALKFSDGQIQLDLSVTPDSFLIAFSDQGIGIPDGESEMIFELFERGSNVGAIRGLGVGLHLAKQLVMIINGNIYVKSAGPDMGAQFVLELPIIDKG